MTSEQAMNAAVQHHRAGRLPEAEEIYRQILAQNPTHAGAIHLLGVIRKQIGDYNEAIDLISRSIQLRPDVLEPHNNLGNALRAVGRFDEAVASFQRAIRLQPDCAEAHSNLGNALHDLGRYSQAVESYQRALRIKPTYFEAWNNLGNTLYETGEFSQSAAACRQAIQLSPDYADAHWNLSNALLVQGQFREGWAEYEWRWRWKDFPSLRDFQQPRWNGEEFQGKTILLHIEQGIGDALQFLRYLPRVAERSGRVVLECQPELHRLLQGFPGTMEVVSEGNSLPPFDLHCPLLSLGSIFNTEAHSIPSVVPYLKIDPQIVDAWKKRLESVGAGLRVGLVWAGNPSHKRDRQRSLALLQFLSLLKLNDVIFFSLQKGPASDQIHSLPSDIKLIDLTHELFDLADTAGLISQLDLVIGADTAVVHLAGALAKPVWVLLPNVPDWRWLLNRDDSPWYPTARLFRQANPGDWPGVIERVRACCETAAAKS